MLLLLLFMYLQNRVSNRPLDTLIWNILSHIDEKVLLVENILNWRHFLRFDDDDDTIVLERQLLVSSNSNIKGILASTVFRQNRHLQGSKLKAWHIFVKHVILWIGCDKFLNIINHILLHLNQASRLFTTSLSDAFTCFQCNIILTYIW